jgi:hypothetical protein
VTEAIRRGPSLENADAGNGGHRPPAFAILQQITVKNFEREKRNRYSSVYNTPSIYSMKEIPNDVIPKKNMCIN